MPSSWLHQYMSRFEMGYLQGLSWLQRTFKMYGRWCWRWISCSYLWLDDLTGFSSFVHISVLKIMRQLLRFWNMLLYGMVRYLVQIVEMERGENHRISSASERYIPSANTSAWYELDQGDLRVRSSYILDTRAFGGKWPVPYMESGILVTAKALLRHVLQWLQAFSLTEPTIRLAKI